MLDSFKGDTPQARRNRTIAAVLGGGALALVMLLRRGSGQAPESAAIVTPSPAVDPGQGGAPGFPTTFADNGAGYGELSTALTNGLAEVGSALDYLATVQSTGSPSTPTEPQSPVVVNVAAAAPAQPGVLAPTGVPHATAQAKQPTQEFWKGQPIQKRAKDGKRYITIKRDGYMWHDYMDPDIKSVRMGKA